MKILLHENSLNLRGSSVALFDYAFFLKKIYKHECYIVYNETEHTNNEKVILKFKDNFPVYSYKNFSEVQNISKNINAEIFYIIKSGNNDGKILNNIKTCVHAVFPHSENDRHGDVYACVSRWLSEIVSKGVFPYVPHMINLPQTKKNLRSRLSIPDSATVIGRYGGYDSFDIGFVLNAVTTSLLQRDDLYYIFCNTPPFVTHPRVFFVNATASLENKDMFINTCDGLLHARHRGETFGLTILEFMSRKKPILTYGQSQEKNHYCLLDGQGIIYNNENELLEYLYNFKKENILYRQLDNYIPENVIKKFHEVFLK